MLKRRARRRTWLLTDRGDGLVEVTLNGRMRWVAIPRGLAGRQVARFRQPGDRVFEVATDGYRSKVG